MCSSRAVEPLFGLAEIDFSNTALLSGAMLPIAFMKEGGAFPMSAPVYFPVPIIGSSWGLVASLSLNCIEPEITPA